MLQKEVDEVLPAGRRFVPAREELGVRLVAQIEVERALEARQRAALVAGSHLVFGRAGKMGGLPFVGRFELRPMGGGLACLIPLSRGHEASFCGVPELVAPRRTSAFGIRFACARCVRQTLAKYPEALEERAARRGVVQ